MNELLRYKIAVVTELVKYHICIQLGIDYAALQSKIGPENLIRDLGADSLDLVELIITLEEEFSVEIPNSLADSFTEKSVQEICQACVDVFVHKHTQGVIVEDVPFDYVGHARKLPATIRPVYPTGHVATDDVPPVTNSQPKAIKRKALISEAIRQAKQFAGGEKLIKLLKVLKQDFETEEIAAKEIEAAIRKMFH